MLSYIRQVHSDMFSLIYFKMRCILLIQCPLQVCKQGGWWWHNRSSYGCIEWLLRLCTASAWSSGKYLCCNIPLWLIDGFDRCLIYLLRDICWLHATRWNKSFQWFYHFPHFYGRIWEQCFALCCLRREPQVLPGMYLNYLFLQLLHILTVNMIIFWVLNDLLFPFCRSFLLEELVAWHWIAMGIFS